MKTLNNTLFGLIFSLTVITGFSQKTWAAGTDKNAGPVVNLAPSDTSSSPSEKDDEFDFDFSKPFFFSDKVTVYVYGDADELLYSGSFTREELKNDEVLKGWLKKSEFLLSIDQQHYYYAKK